MNHSAEIGLQGSPGALQMQGPTRCPRYLLGGVETLGMCLSSIRCSALSTCCCKKLPQLLDICHQCAVFSLVSVPLCLLICRQWTLLGTTSSSCHSHVSFLPCLLPLWLACSGVCNQACMDCRSSSDCFMQTTTQTDKQQTETKVVPVFLAGFSLLSGRRGIGLFGGNHVVSWAVTVLPCTRHACICTFRFQTSLHAQTMQVRKKHKKKFFSVCVRVSHCSVAEEALDPFVGTMLSRCQSQL